MEDDLVDLTQVRQTSVFADKCTHQTQSIQLPAEEQRYG